MVGGDGGGGGVVDIRYLDKQMKKGNMIMVMSNFGKKGVVPPHPCPYLPLGSDAYDN